MRESPEKLLERYLAISRAIAGQLDFQSVLGQIADEASALFQHDHLDISIISPHRKDCCVAFEIGLATEWGETSDDEMGSITLTVVPKNDSDATRLRA